MDLILIKLGGSLITDKKSAYTVNRRIIHKIALEIKELFSTGKYKIVLGNGAGSFAHQSAKKYRTKDGFGSREGKYGFCMVQNDAAKLNRILLEALLEEKLPVFSLQPSACFIASNQIAKEFIIETLPKLLDHNIIPVVYGDAVIDEQLGSTIISTDYLMELIVKYLISLKIKPNLVINLGNYDGVTKPNGQIIKEINRSNYPEVKKYFYTNQEVDVTGGMEYKVDEFLKLADLGVSSVIANGNIKGILREITNGNHIGTLIR
jgi:isopentenyl phosphate kinase